MPKESAIEPVAGPDGSPSGQIPVVLIDGVPVHAASLGQTVEIVAQWIADGTYGTIYTPNVDDIVKAHRLPDFRNAILAMRMRVADGRWIVRGSRIAGSPLKASLTGRLIPEALAARFGGSVPMAFFGGGPGVATRAGRALEARGAHVVAAIEPPMGFAVGSAEDWRETERLRDSRAQVVFVCLGAPKQALWMQRHASELQAVLIGVGAAVDVLAGESPEAPRWMTRLGFEWGFRLLHEPRRLARRYLWDDPRFFWWMLRQRFGHGRFAAEDVR